MSEYRKRTNSGWFKPGQSGNPGGRPKQHREVTELAQEKSSQAIETLHAIMVDEKKPASARVQAANAILDRGLGKPQAHVAFRSDMPDAPVDCLTDAEIGQRIDAALEELEALAKQSHKKKSK